MASNVVYTSNDYESIHIGSGRMPVFRFFTVVV